MQILNLEDENIIEVKETFWRRQFQKESTSSQNSFDWAFGVFMPLICFLFDPIVFESSMGGSLLGKYKPFAYVLSFASLTAMSIFLVWGKELKWLNGFLSGLFVIGGIISLIVGILLIPFSLIGLILLIGVLGFTPFFSSFVFIRNSFRAYDFAKPHFEGKTLVRAFILSAMFSLITPVVVNSEINRMLENLVKGDVNTIRKNTKYLKLVSAITNFESLLRTYKMDEGYEKEEISKAYEELTGKNFESSLKSYFD